MSSKRNIPTHVAIIMDGNRRWAKINNKAMISGHRAGFKAIKEIVRHANSLGIRFLSLFAFSTENWQRKDHEVTLLMNLFTSVLKNELNELMDEDIRIIHLGRKDRIPKKLLEIILKIEEKSEQNQGITVFLALDYGGRDEILRAVNKLNKENKNAEITETDFDLALDTAGYPNPDLIIRTSGERRISNFLVWQSAYSEFIFVDDLMPDFSPSKFDLAINEYSSRLRRYGS